MRSAGPVRRWPTRQPVPAVSDDGGARVTIYSSRYLLDYSCHCWTRLLYLLQLNWIEVDVFATTPCCAFRVWPVGGNARTTISVVMNWLGCIEDKAWNSCAREEEDIDKLDWEIIFRPSSAFSSLDFPLRHDLMIEPADYTLHKFTGEGEKLMLFLYFENVLVRGKWKEENSQNNLAYIDKAIFRFFYELLTIYGKLGDEPKGARNVKYAYHFEFGTKWQQEQTISRMMDITLDSGIAKNIMKVGDTIHRNQGFKTTERFGLLGAATMQWDELSGFSVYRNVIE